MVKKIKKLTKRVSQKKAQDQISAKAVRLSQQHGYAVSVRLLPSPVVGSRGQRSIIAPLGDIDRTIGENSRDFPWIKAKVTVVTGNAQDRILGWPLEVTREEFTTTYDESVVNVVKVIRTAIDKNSEGVMAQLIAKAIMWDLLNLQLAATTQETTSGSEEA